MSFNLNLLDAAFVLLAFIFVVTAFFRGFIREIFSLFNWVLSLTLSYLLAPQAAELIAIYSKNKLVADISARSIVFVAVFFIISISTSGLCKALKEKMPKAFDRSLGVFYGLVKTLLIFGFVYSLAFNLYGFLLGKKVDESYAKLPTWFTEAKSRNILKVSGDILDPAVTLFFDAVVKNFDHVAPKSESLDEKIDEITGKKSEEKKEEKALDPDSDELGKALEDSGYNKKDIEKMNRLIEIIGK